MPPSGPAAAEVGGDTEDKRRDRGARALERIAIEEERLLLLLLIFPLLLRPITIERDAEETARIEGIRSRKWRETGGKRR